MTVETPETVARYARIVSPEEPHPCALPITGLAGSCADTGSSESDSADSSNDVAMRVAEHDTDGEADDAPAEDERPPLRNPWIDAGDLPGPVPLFEALNDPQGRRYVVGEGAFVETEGGEVQRFPSVLTMTRVDEKPVPSGDAGSDDADGATPIVRTATQKVSAELAATVASAEPPDADIPVLIVVQDGETGIQVELERAMAMGTVRSWEDYEQERDVLIDEQEERIAIQTSATRADVEASGGLVLARGRGLAWVSAIVPATAVEAIAQRSEVWSIDHPGSQGVSLDSADGEVHQDGGQIRQYVTSGFTGSGDRIGLNDNMVAAIIELTDDGTTFNTTHGAWRDTDAATLRLATGPGVTGMWNCTTLPCADVASFAQPAGMHATNIAGIIFGDLTNNPPQIASVPLADRDRTSGFAREAKVHMYAATASPNNVVAAFDHLSTLAADHNFPHIVNNSYRFSEIGAVCEGSSAISRAANRAYVSGVAVFSGAGNDEGTSVSCQVGAPGAAIGSFTVGAHLSSATNVDALAIRNGSIFSVTGNGSAWGGNLTQGDNRSIVSLTAAGPRSRRIMADGSVSISSSLTGMTSFATAVVSATALDVMDQHMRTSTWIDSPGQLYATLLLMGDRQGTSGYRTASPDHRWGVGRLRARMFGAGGMDVPYYWYHAATCIGHGEVWDLNLSGANMPDDIEAVKAAAYWYDYRHETNTGAVQVANINISLRNASIQRVADQDVWDNKAVVFSSTWGVEPVILRISGTSGINGHNHPVCGNNQVYVHFSIFAEDSDRESPTYTPASGIGVAPESLEF